MIFVDSNVPMYLVGSDHPLKARARELVERFVRARERLVTDAEIFQEILHRYVAIRRRDAIEPAWSTLRALVDEVLPVEFDDVALAKEIVLEARSLSSRGALHFAVMKTHGVDRILSFDSGFDSLDGLHRVY